MDPISTGHEHTGTSNLTVHTIHGLGQEEPPDMTAYHDRLQAGDYAGDGPDHDKRKSKAKADEPKPQSVNINPASDKNDAKK